MNVFEFYFKEILKVRIRENTGDMTFVCNICDKAVASKSNLRVHMQIHSGERPYKCHQCTKAFRNSGNLKRHERTHTLERPFKCHHCTKAFADSNNLKRHECAHTGEKPYKCNQCTKAFSDPSHLKVHERTHTGEKPFKCQQCPKAFTQSSNLKVHERTHTGERPFKCHKCTKTFTLAGKLRRHESTHTSGNSSNSTHNKEVKCTFKDSHLEEFPQPNTSDRNMSTIEGENGYSYQVYQNQFPMNNQMTYHREIHLEDDSNHSKQSCPNIQSSTSIHPEENSFQDGITIKNVANYPNLSTPFNAMDNATFPHQFISQNIQSTISPLLVNVQTQRGKNIPRLNERKDTNPFSFHTENGQNLLISMSNTGISILDRSMEHQSESVSFPARNITENSSISNVTEETQISYDYISKLPLEFDTSFNIRNTHHSIHQQSVTIKEHLPNENTRSILDNTDMNSQIQNVSLLENTYDQRFTGSSTQNEKGFSFLQMLLED